MSLQFTSNSQPYDSMSALLTFGTEVPNIEESSGAGPIMSFVVLLNTSKAPLNLPLRAVTSKPTFHDSIVSQVIKELTIPGDEDVFVLFPATSHDPLPTPTGIPWKNGYHELVFMLPNCPHDALNFKVGISCIIFLKKSSRAIFQPTEKDGKVPHV